MRYRVFLVTVVGIISLTACGGSSGASTTGPTQAEIRSEGAVPETLSFVAGFFASEYMRDPAGADAEFKGKRVEVSGVVGIFGTNKDSVAYVSLQGASRGAPIQCVFTEPGPKESFPDLVVGQTATVTGIAEGYSPTVKDQEGQFALFMSQGDIITLSDCSVVK